MSAENSCAECGSLIPTGSPGGFCGQCLLGLGLDRPRDLSGSARSAWAQGEGQISEKAGLAVPLSEKPGDWTGRYRLLEEIGHGGCGVVYMAEQTDPGSPQGGPESD